MKITKDTKEEIQFDIEGGEASALIENNKISWFVGQKTVGADKNNLSVNDERFLRDTYKAIGDLLRHVDSNRAVGHKDLDKEALDNDIADHHEYVRKNSGESLIG